MKDPKCCERSERKIFFRWKLTKLSGVNGREMEHLRYSSQGHRGGAIDGDAMATARERTRPSRRSRGY